MAILLNSLDFYLRPKSIRHQPDAVRNSRNAGSVGAHTSLRPPVR